MWFFPSPLRSLPSCLRNLWLLLIEHLSLKWVTAGICENDNCWFIPNPSYVILIWLVTTVSGTDTNHFFTICFVLWSEILTYIRLILIKKNDRSYILSSVQVAANLVRNLDMAISSLKFLLPDVNIMKLSPDINWWGYSTIHGDIGWKDYKIGKRKGRVSSLESTERALEKQAGRGLCIKGTEQFSSLVARQRQRCQKEAKMLHRLKIPVSASLWLSAGQCCIAMNRINRVRLVHVKGLEYPPIVLQSILLSIGIAHKFWFWSKWI